MRDRNGRNVSSQTGFKLHSLLRTHISSVPTLSGSGEVLVEISNTPKNLTELAGEIVAAYVSHNPIPVAELPKLIQSVHGAISGLASGSVSDAAALTVQAERPTPAQIRKSIRDDGITSFIDGKTYKTLKRHLSANGLDPKSYRERFGLPLDYPMVAPSYAEQRSALAKAIGLGLPGSRRAA